MYYKIWKVIYTIALVLSVFFFAVVAGTVISAIVYPIVVEEVLR